MRYKRKKGEVINFDTPFPGEGRIVGCSHTEMPVLGHGWIVEVTSKIPLFLNYPFTHIIVFDSWMY